MTEAQARALLEAGLELIASNNGLLPSPGAPCPCSNRGFDEGVRHMACITLTRIALSHLFAALPATGWEVAFEGQHVATYAEERDGWLRQIGSFGLDALLRSHAQLKQCAGATR
jgi:hypothetical protein